MGRTFDHPSTDRRPAGQMAVVRQLRPVAPINPRHPSLFDQNDPDLFAADRCVILTQVEAQAIAGVLRHARGHVPSPKALDEAIALLGEASRRPITPEVS